MTPPTAAPPPRPARQLLAAGRITRSGGRTITIAVTAAGVSGRITGLAAPRRA